MGNEGTKITSWASTPGVPVENLRSISAGSNDTSWEAFESISDSDAEVSVAGPVSLDGCKKYDGVSGSPFLPMSPHRLLDTRRGPKLGAGASLDLKIAGLDGVPADAVAVALNVTLVDATAPGWVQVLPTGQGVVGASSNLNADTAGQTIPNSVIAPIGNGGSITLFTSNGGHLIVDISGYFAKSAGATSAGRFNSVTPLRVLDTRNGAKPAPGSVTTVSMTGVGLPTPSRMAAVALNVTAENATAPGFVQVAGKGQLVPAGNSNLNITHVGQTIPNMVIVPVVDGKIDIFTDGGTNLIVDVFGWFSSATEPVRTSGLFVPMTPERVLDTRPRSPINHGSSLFNGIETGKPGPKLPPVLLGFQGLPYDGVSAVIVNITATDATAPGYVQVAAHDSLVPGTSSNLNLERAGQTVPNLVIMPTTSGWAYSEIYNDNGTHLIADISGFFTR